MRLLPSCALLLLLAGCASGAAPAGGGRSPRAPGVRQTSLGTEVLAARQEPVAPRTVPGDPAAAYAVLPDAFRDLRLTVAGSDDRMRLVESERMVLRGTLAGQPLANFLDCGFTAGGRTANVYRVELRVRTTVQPVAGGAQLVTEVEGVASNPTTSSPPVRCTSTGVLEDRLAERVRAALGGAASAG